MVTNNNMAKMKFSNELDVSVENLMEEISEMVANEHPPYGSDAEQAKLEKYINLSIDYVIKQLEKQKL